MAGVALLVAPPIAAADLGEGPVAYYPFNGNADDASGNENHCTLEGSPALTRGADGTPDGAYQFDGVDDYLDCGNFAGFPIDAAITVAAWVRPLSFLDAFVATRWKTEVSFTGSWILAIEESGSPRFGVTADCSAHVGVTSGTTVSSHPQVYTHLAGVYDTTSNDLEIFVNGEYTDTATGPAGLCVSDAHLLIAAARYFAGDFYYEGAIDELRIYDRVLSPEEILELYASQAFVFADGFESGDTSAWFATVP
jgi:hypothetical protein